MDGCVDVCAAVFRCAVAIGRVEIALLRVGMKLSFERETFGRGPVQSICRKIVSKIDPLAAGERQFGRIEPDDESKNRKQHKPASSNRIISHETSVRNATPKTIHGLWLRSKSPRGLRKIWLYRWH